MPSIPAPPSTTLQSSNELPRTLWMGDLDPGFDEYTIVSIWSTLGMTVKVKLIKSKNNSLIPINSTSSSSLSTNANSLEINGVSFIDPSKTNLHHAGYCFVEFDSFENAQQGLSLNASAIPNIPCNTTNSKATNDDGKRKFRLNWANGATLHSTILPTPEFSLFVGDLSPFATEADLLSLFQTKYNSVKTVRVMTDPVTGASRCFGFVRFANEAERRHALIEMNGIQFQGRQLRVAYATPRNNVPQQAMPANFNQQPMQPSITQHISQQPQQMHYQSQQQIQQIQPLHQPLQVSLQQTAPMLLDTANVIVSLQMPNGSNATTTVFVGGLNPRINELQLFELFKSFGTITDVKIPPGKQCGFVKYNDRIEAEAAINGLQGFLIMGSPIRLSWGHIPAPSYIYAQS